jgi:hypothetical protein
MHVCMLSLQFCWEHLKEIDHYADLGVHSACSFALVPVLSVGPDAAALVSSLSSHVTAALPTRRVPSGFCRARLSIVRSHDNIKVDRRVVAGEG